MRRREFIKCAGGLAAALAAPRAPAFHDQMQAWQSFRLNYTVELPQDSARARLWVPMPTTGDDVYQYVQGAMWDGKASVAGFRSVPGIDPVGFFFAEWTDRRMPRKVTVSVALKLADRKFDPSKLDPDHHHGAGRGKPTDAHLAPMRRVPLTPELKLKARELVSGVQFPIAKGRALFDWVAAQETSPVKVDDPAGEREWRNPVFVAMARSVGIPARVVFGLRVDDSEISKHIGSYGDVSRAQHVRAEFHVQGRGWVPVDADDVHIASHEEGVKPGEPRFAELSDRLFGLWEPNWVEYNRTVDVALNPSPAAGKLPFFVFPVAELDGKLRDSRDPGSFSYRIESAELVGTGGKF